MNRRLLLGNLVKIHREHRNYSQEYVADNCGVKTNRSAIAHLEQGIRLPKNHILSAICEFLDIPKPMWENFTKTQSLLRFEFEDILQELTGRIADIDSHDQTCIDAVESLISRLFSVSPSPEQLYDLFNSILVYYGCGPVTESFFRKYFSPSSFGSTDSFRSATDVYQIDAIRIFPTFTEAFDKISSSENIAEILSSLNRVDVSNYQNRSDWDLIEIIEDELLPDLGYISAKTVRQEATERQWLIEQLGEIAVAIADSTAEQYLSSMTSKRKNKIDSLLRKFDSNLAHGISSPLFLYDADILRREAERLAPPKEDRLTRMENTQQRALRNLSNYLSADHMDIYVATSMRSDADYVSVNHFVKLLFEDSKIRPLKLRYFNPTQSWIDDRVAKGLVEALMLKRASVTIYMAQKSDTFGKDSEASVALGQGKPVIVYVPKLRIEGDETIDVEDYFKKTRAELISVNETLSTPEEVDETIDDEALIASIITAKISASTDESICDSVREVWADFDLYSESARVPESSRDIYRQWLDSLRENERHASIPSTIRVNIVGVLVAVSINFEKRAKVFREVHPLALQVILSSGVLNGILVARTVRQCAEVLESIIKNELTLDMKKDEDNYRVIEKVTNSTIRVISRHQLLKNSFEAYYRKEDMYV